MYIVIPSFLDGTGFPGTSFFLTIYFRNYYNGQVNSRLILALAGAESFSIRHKT